MAFYPRYRRVIDFQEMRVHVDSGRREFTAEVPDLGAAAAVIQGRYLMRDGRIHVAAWSADG
jgi:hypothetical protein